MLGGCVHDSLVACSNGLTCPVGTVCDLAHDGCVLGEQLAACSGLADGDPCTYGSGIDARCIDQVCIVPACGNRIVEPGELCDDGNLSAGDGCNASCTSNETCGNGIRDVGEDCDDGGARSHDGCSSACRDERLTSSIASDGRPVYGEAYAAAWDGDHQRLVVVTREGAKFETWTWDAAGWHRLTATPIAAGNAFPPLVYDSDRKLPLLVTTNGTAVITWTLVNDHWKQVASGGVPATPGSSMAYDEAHHVAVWVGADDTATETWTWNGVVWTRQTPTTAPSRRWYGAMAYDPAHQRVVMFGGLDPGPSNTLYDETWEWDGADWTERLAVTRPPARYEGSLVSTSTGAMLVGGVDLGSTLPFDDRWTWDGSAWALQASGDPFSGQVATDRASQRIWRVGTDFVTGTLNVFQRLGLSGWGDEQANVVPTYLGIPSSRNVAYDAHAGRLVFVSPFTAWSWDGAWHALPPPPSASNANLAYDPVRERVVGSTGNGTFELVGDQWVNTVGSPGIDVIAFDGKRGKIIGMGPGVIATWDGATWTPVMTTGAPFAGWQNLVYDARRGVDVALVSGQVFELDGTTWTASFAPPPSAQYELLYDPNTGSRWFWDLQTADGSIGFWELAGGTWVRRMVSFDVFGKVLIAADPIGQRVLAYELRSGEVSSLRFTSTTPDEDCPSDADTDGDGLAGCGDPDCWGRCTPLCPPFSTCTMPTPGCGDGVCDPLETHALCPVDCM